MLGLCENEMMSIKFFRICKKSMISIENHEIEKWYEGGDIVPATLSSHHLVLLPSPWIGDKLTSEDESYVDIHDVNVPTPFETGDVSPSAYVTCICSSLWWDGMVSLVDIAAGDVINVYFIHPHGPWKTFN